MKKSTLIIILCIGVFFQCMAQVQDEEKFLINLKSRKFIPQIGIKSETLYKLQQQIVTEKIAAHVMIQFKEIPTTFDRELLLNKGIKLLNYVGSNSWFASVSDPEAINFTDPELIRKHPVLSSVRWVGEIAVEDKIAPLIRERKIGEWVRTSDGKLNLIVTYFKDINIDYVISQLEALGAEIQGGVPVVNNLTITVEENKIRDIASKDFIIWIETIPPPCGPESDRIRNHVQADLAQSSPLNLTGSNINIGVFEWNHVWQSHLDFSGRAIRKDATNYDPGQHTTMVAGIIGGNGSRSSANGGTTNQWRGIAPSSNLYSYNAHSGGTLEDEYLDFASDLQTAISTDFIDVGNNSWGTTTGCVNFQYGSYEGICTTLDAAVKGDFDRPVTIVFSAGNERDGYGWDNSSGHKYYNCIGTSVAPFNNYGTINYPKAAKNIIAVGAIDSYNNRMTNYSSWGPLADGRLKPDIVASGHYNGTPNSEITVLDNVFGIPTGNPNQQGYRTPNYTTSSSNYVYAWMTQTSCAAAVTTGCIALLLERYRDIMKTNLNPLPSTTKALLIQSALDLDDNTSWYNPGPDNASGYGLLQIKNAVDLVDSHLFFEGKISSNRPDEYKFSLPPGATQVKITLVWDDPPASLNATSALVNDLDLSVYDPDNNQYFPWTLDPANPSNPAIRTVPDHLNNVEQVFVNQNLTTGTWRVIVSPYALVQSPQRYSLVANYNLNGEVDVIQVLDRSGSMSEMASSGMQGTKIEKLRDAASQFVAIMKPDIGNRLGLVQFNQNVVPFPANSGVDLSFLDNAKANLLQSSTIPNMVNGGTTSIGDGLREALTQFLNTPGTNNRSILLVTDGMENTPTWISDAQPDLINNDVTVHVLGLGYGSGINENKLTNLAQATGGSYRITSDHLVFQKLFLEVLAGAVNWSVINDPIGVISNGSEVFIPVIITSDQVNATFTAFWESIDDAIKVELITPSGKILPINPAITNVRYMQHLHDVSYQLDFPLTGDLSGEWAGNWKLKLTGTNNIKKDSQVRYSTSVFAENGPGMEVSLDKLYNLTGDEIRIRAHLTRDGEPLVGAIIEAFGDVPIVGAGNVLHEGKVNWDLLQQPRVINGDTLGIIDRKLQLLTIANGNEVLKRGATQFQLYDDGLHGDGVANDGIYSNKFIDTKTQGSYTFRFVASGIPAGSGRTSTCEWSRSFFNEININSAYSDIGLTQRNVTAGNIVYDLSVALKDIYGNFMGPGHNVTAKITYRGTSRDLKLTDHIDGTYSNEIILTEGQIKSGVVVDIYVDGKKFTMVKPSLKKWSLSFHGGAAIPIGNFSNDYKSGLAVILDFDYHFTNRLSLVGLVGYNDFKAKTTGIDNKYWINVSANVRYHRPFRYPWSVYFGGGPGVFIPGNGSTEFGANLGIGVNYEYNSRINFELGADYHTLFGNNIQFTQSHIGVVLKF